MLNAIIQPNKKLRIYENQKAPGKKKKYLLVEILFHLRSMSRQIKITEGSKNLDYYDRFAIIVYQENFCHWMKILIEQEEISFEAAIELVNGNKNTI